MEEIWKSIPGYEGMYEVSDMGRVKSLKRLNSRGHMLSVRILKGGPDSNGYSQVCLYNDVGSRTVQVHQLMAITFLGHVPNGTRGLVVDHIDNDQLNNALVNLQLISHRENTSKDKRGGSSQYRGVYWHKKDKRWHSRIYIDGKHKYLGQFDDELEASEVYQKALRELTS